MTAPFDGSRLLLFRFLLYAEYHPQYPRKESRTSDDYNLHSYPSFAEQYIIFSRGGLCYLSVMTMSTRPEERRSCALSAVISLLTPMGKAAVMV